MGYNHWLARKAYPKFMFGNLFFSQNGGAVRTGTTLLLHSPLQQINCAIAERPTNLASSAPSFSHWDQERVEHDAFKHGHLKIINWLFAKQEFCMRLGQLLH
jgi:hypothetical protein